jgi:hypothetical protein
MNDPSHYRIRVRGQVPAGWRDRLGGLEILSDVDDEGGPVTTLVGELRDQAALAGVLDTLYRLHLSILGVTRVRADGSEAR